MKKIAILTVAILLMTAVSAFAVAIDFRTDFDIPDGSSSYTYDPAGLTLYALPDGATLYQDTEDGVGVIFSYEDDEIEGREFLHLQFAEEQYLDSILISDLFYEPYNYTPGSYSEIGYYRLGSGDWIEFTAPTSNLPSPVTNGELLITLDSVIVSDIWFKAPGWMGATSLCKGYNEDHEFSVAGINIKKVPEPSTLLLLGTGVIGLAGFRRRNMA